MLGKRRYPLECAAAKVCREAGARVITNMFVKDMDLADFNALDNRRLEVVADGTLWRDAQLAVDTTLVSPLCRDGSARRRAAHHDGAALEAARKRKEDTYPELTGEGGRARLVVLAAEVGGRWSTKTAQFLCSLAKGRVRLWCSREGWSRLGCDGGTQSSHAALQDRLLSLCWTVCHQGQVTMHPQHTKF